MKSNWTFYKKEPEIYQTQNPAYIAMYKGRKIYSINHGQECTDAHTTNTIESAEEDPKVIASTMEEFFHHYSTHCGDYEKVNNMLVKFKKDINDLG